MKAAILPDSVTGIGREAFKGCTALSEFRYPMGWKEVPGGGMPNLGCIFENCPSLTSITVLEGITAIPEVAFRGASYVTTFDLPRPLNKTTSLKNAFTRLKPRTVFSYYYSGN